MLTVPSLKKGFWNSCNWDCIDWFIKPGPGGSSVSQARKIRIEGYSPMVLKGLKEVQAGQRAALNLTGIAKEEVQRGNQLAMPESLFLVI
ncbi:MAG: hypothetical protein CM1200mP30_26920 [Pseudomonadota bacterium]|nr:MAG: hypothetical protein CM1200mP30_26920 [Pseudomonadota bacterium]